jgi:hypothetical protein
MSSNLCLLREMFKIQSLNQNVLQGTVFESVKGLSIEHVRFLIYPFSSREETTNTNNQQPSNLPFLTQRRNNKHKQSTTFGRYVFKLMSVMSNVLNAESESRN